MPSCSPQVIMFLIRNTDDDASFVVNLNGGGRGEDVICWEGKGPHILQCPKLYD